MRGIAAITGIGTVFETFGQLPSTRSRRDIGAISSALDGLAGLLGKLGIGGAGAKEADPSFEDRFNALKHKTMFEPGTGGKLAAQPIALSLNVDGRTLAQVVSEQLEYLYEQSTGAPLRNGLANAPRGDNSSFGM